MLNSLPNYILNEKLYSYNIMLLCEKKLHNDENIWTQFLNCVKERCSVATFQNWFAPIKLLEIKDGVVRIEVPNVFVKDYLLSNYGKEIADFFPCLPDGNLSIEFVISKVVRKISTPKSNSKRTSKNKISKSNLLKLNKNYTFDNFIEGPSNQFVKSIAMGIASKVSENYSPFFLYGNVGLGKTHLLQSIARSASELNCKLKIKYITTETFINELVDCLKKKQVDKMKRFYRSLDVLLVDDIQFLQKRINFEEEFCNTFETLINDGKQIVIASSHPPAQLQLSERLIAMMECGLTTHLPIPDFETRTSILLHKAKQKELPLKSDVASFIAERVYNNVRQLEGAINRLSVYSHLFDREITRAFVENALKEVLSHKSDVGNKVDMESILKAVSITLGVRICDIRGKSRMKDISCARQIAIYLAREMSNLSISSISLYFSRTHSTILHAHKNIKDKMSKDQFLFIQIDLIRRKIS